MPPSDPTAALECLARGKTWEDAFRLYFVAVPGAGRVDAEIAFQQAAEQGWLLSAIPELRLLVEAWQAVARIQDDADRARRASSVPLSKLVKAAPDSSAEAIQKLSDGTAKLIGEAINGEKIALSALSAVSRHLAAWRRASVAFAREHKPIGREQRGHEEWRRACSKLIRIEVADGNLAMALSLVGRIRDPVALQVEHLDPLAQALEQHRQLEQAAHQAAATGDTATLVQLAPALTTSRREVAELAAKNKPPDDGPEDPLAAGIATIRAAGPDRLP